MIEKKTDKLDELLAETEKLEEKLRGPNEYYIAEIYNNLGQKKKSEEYFALSMKHIEMLGAEALEKIKNDETA